MTPQPFEGHPERLGHAGEDSFGDDSVRRLARSYSGEETRSGLRLRRLKREVTA